MITDTTLKLWQVNCDACGGHGRTFERGVGELLRRERIAKGAASKELARVARIPYERYCNFEKGRTHFSTPRILKLCELLNNWEEITAEIAAQNKADGGQR